jgi:DNA-directed RNA polymerase specialized sigma subunit
MRKDITKEILENLHYIQKKSLKEIALILNIKTSKWSL